MKKSSSDYYSPLFYKSIFAALFVVILIIGYHCSASLHVPTIDDARISGIPVDTLEMGRRLYIRDCSSCHTLYLPRRYTASEWETQVDWMQERSKISDDEKRIILNYLQVKSKK